MKRFLISAACALFFTSNLACSDDNKPNGTPTDAGGRDASVADANDDATTSNPDATDDAGGGEDRGIVEDTGVDGGMRDAGPELVPQMEPGDHVQTIEARIEIGDTFAEVKQNLGTGARSGGMGARSYEHTLAGGVEMTIWFANTNLDDDDAAPNDVDDTDQVLWIAVKGGFTGKTSKNIGIGSTKAAVEAATPAGYGPAPHSNAITMPEPGTLDEYYETGFLVTYDNANVVRTFTICRAYPQAPDAPINPSEGLLDFGGGMEVRGLVGFTPGSRVGEVTALLGPPDGQGNVVVAGQTLQVLSYGFIGIEVFASITPGLERALFISIHAPYYGKINGGMAGIGSTRAEMEAELMLGTGMASAMNMNFICYEGGAEPDVAVTYANGMIASSITTPLIRSSMSTTCP